MELKLYSYYRSSCSYRVRIALHYKNLNFSYQPVHLIENGGEQHKSEYLKINSKKEVPTLIHNDFAISQSVAIIEYLEEAFPEKSLLPKDPKNRALVRQAYEIINSGIQPFQNLSILNKLQNDFKINDNQKNQWIIDIITNGFKALELFLENHSGIYTIGDQVTAADLFLVPQVYNANRFKIDMNNFKNIKKINDNCLKLEAFKKAHPDLQPDFPGSTI